MFYIKLSYVVIGKSIRESYASDFITTSDITLFILEASYCLGYGIILADNSILSEQVMTNIKGSGYI